MPIRFRPSVLAPIVLFLGLPLLAQDVASKISAEINATRTALGALPATDLVKQSTPGLQEALTDADAQIRAQRPYVALEALAGARPQVQALTRASAGWGGQGKGIDELAKEWELAGKALASQRGKFPAQATKQSQLIRALAEQSLGQVQENYAASLDYGRTSGVQFGAYYIGHAEGHMAFALFSSALRSPDPRMPIPLPSLAVQLDAFEKELLAAYAKPGATAQHTNFIIANASLKLARELDQQGYRAGALFIFLRAWMAFGQATLPAVPPEQLPTLQAAAGQMARKFTGISGDHSIGEAYLQKAQLALERSAAGGEAGDRQRLRAAALLQIVIPRYFEILEGKQ